MISIKADPTLRYPGGEHYYSPDEPFPEYKLDHISPCPNPVYRAVRDCLAQAGLDRARFDTRDWNPLGEFIQPGSRVFVLCNFVLHRESNETVRELWAKCTHGSVLRALLDYVLLAIDHAGFVRFGNAPIQGCNWDEVLKESGANAVLDFYNKRGLGVQARDLRLFVVERDRLRRTLRTVTRDQPQNAVEIELGKDSLLSEFYLDGKPEPHFRVADYDPHKTEAFHSAESHRYIINREILDSDVVISLPKLKTHSKVGITCALKGFVGTVGHKDCLAHHRFGSPQIGGDEYPRKSRLRFFLSYFHDWVYSRHEPGFPKGLLQAADAMPRHLLNRMGAIQGGGWHGNDTTWRMALDVARIAHYADSLGGMQDTPQRGNLTFIDGIIGGEGEGPLTPQPVDSGALVFGNNVAESDLVACRLMGFEPTSIPIIRESFRPMKYPLCNSNSAERLSVCWNGQFLKWDAIPLALSRSFRPPEGWREVLEKGA